jgi:hypothetical protein
MGLKQSPYDRRDFKYNRLGVAPLPPSAMLSGWTVKNQGQYESCTAFATCTCAEILMKDVVPFSERFNWYCTRTNEGTFPQNVGVCLRDALLQAQKVGLAPESLCPYVDPKNTDIVNVPPNSWATSFAKFFKIGEFSRCNTVNDIKSAIVDGHPVEIGMFVWTEFLSQHQMDVVKPAKYNMVGGHAMTVIGYDEVGLIICNSWDIYWGYNCLCRLPYDMASDSNIVFEAWAVTTMARRDA